MDKENKKMESILDEYKMSMGGSFFNMDSKNPEDEIELLLVENTIKNHLFDTHELLAVYDQVSEGNKRKFFKDVIVEFIKFKFAENKD
ncbi:MAG: hypothetical protein HZC47_02760 [Methanobacterium sp.]|uniref:hypothetical protein n=1 Tax=Methanobacterium sp. TaxID=2164 RepID=UPI003D658610|nr:hypothetical protein [Methanobacterium sp.]